MWFIYADPDIPLSNGVEVMAGKVSGHIGDSSSKIDIAMSSARPLETEEEWLCHAAYASVAWGLPHALQGGGFVAQSLAVELSAEFSKPMPPAPSSPLDEDTALSELLGGLPQQLRRRLHADWQELSSSGEKQPTCLLAALAGCDEVPLADIDRLGDCVMDHLVDTLVERYRFAVDMARYLVAEARNEAILRAIERAPAGRIENYMAGLQAKGMISGERVLVYARRGQSPIFHAALGHSAALDAEMVEAFIEDGGLRVLERILLRTDFAPVMQQTILATYAEAAALA